METLDSSEVRHLIIKAKLTGGQISDIARTVVDMAVRNGSLHEGRTRHGPLRLLPGHQERKDGRRWLADSQCRGDQVQGAGMSEKVVWQLFQQYAAAVGVPGIAPSRKRGGVGRSRWPH